jgi:short-subunit dehydrogenase
MRLELKPWSIHVSIIEPGPIASKFVVHALEAFDRNIDEANSHYRDIYVKQRKRLQKTKPGRFKLPPEAVLEKLIHALEAPRPKIRYTVTIPTLVMTWCKRLLPPRMLDRVIDNASD